MKVIFLDIDGVLNSSIWNNNHESEISDGTFIDKEKIKLLAVLVKETHAKIILHSGWRFWFDDELKPLRTEARRLVKFLNDEGLSIDGLTPDMTTEEIRMNKKFSLVKADEILMWLENHDNITNWVVIDDLDLHNLQVNQHQVKPNQKIGLTYEDIKKAEKILLD